MTTEPHSQFDGTLTAGLRKSSNLLLVGEGLHILNPLILAAIENGDTGQITRYAQRQVHAGAGALAVNLGPGRHMQQKTPWVIDTLFQAVDAPLFISSNVLSLDAVLRQHGSRITINAVTANPETLPAHLETARNYDTGIVVLLVSPGLVPSGINDRLRLADNVLQEAIRTGLPLNRLYLDPVVGCRPDPIAWKISRGMPDMGTVIETISLVKELNGLVKTIVGLGNGSLGLPREKRSAYHCTILPLLAAAGLDAAIMNCLDGDLVSIAGNIHANADLSTLSRQNKKELKTAA